MTFSSNAFVLQVLVPALVMFFLFWSVIGAAVGLGLILASAATIRMFRAVNRYVSTRVGLKPLAMPHDVGAGVRRHRRLIGAIFVLGAAYSVFALCAWFDNAAIVYGLKLRYPREFVAVVVESVRWSLIVFGLLAIAIGVMLLFFPAALTRVEAHANSWYSVRRLTLGADTMYLSLDRLVEAYPRTSGAILVVGALYVAAQAALLWFRLP